MVAIAASLADRPERAAALDEAFLGFVSRWHRGAPGSRIEIPYEYLLVLARKSGASSRS
jgi:hypothetical protein